MTAEIVRFILDGYEASGQCGITLQDDEVYQVRAALLGAAPLQRVEALTAVVERVIHAEANTSPDHYLERMKAREAFRQTFTPGLLLTLLTRLQEPVAHG